MDSIVTVAEPAAAAGAQHQEGYDNGGGHYSGDRKCVDNHTNFLSFYAGVDSLSILPTTQWVNV